jgi:hypothetical protein
MKNIFSFVLVLVRGHTLRRRGDVLQRPEGAFYTLVPIRPRRRGERRSLRTFPGVSLRPPLAFNPDTPRRLSTPTDAFQLHPVLQRPEARGWATQAARVRAPRVGAKDPRTARDARLNDEDTDSVAFV